MTYTLRAQPTVHDPTEAGVLETDLFGGVGRPPEGVTWNMTRQSDKKRKTVTEGTSCKQTLLYCHTGGRGLESAELRES